MKNQFRQLGYRLTNLIRYIMAFKDIFKNSSDYNEKTIIGFLSFLVMIAAMVVDLITGYWGRELRVNEFIFNAFMYITLGSFGIAGLEKFAPGAKKDNTVE